MNLSVPGKIVIISSPSGGGKTSICQALLTDEYREKGWSFSISYTTRSKRPNEEDGREYYFVTDTEFDRLVQENFFAESCLVHGYQYGTPRRPLEEAVEKGGVILLDVDVKGARKLREEYLHAIMIFIRPPSLEALRERLKKRGTESDEQLKVRFDNAVEEMKLHDQFDYVVINEQLEKAVQEVRMIILDHN